jgi:hypothetical protein
MSLTVTKGVSPNNPCPFLRALVAHGLLPDDVVAIKDVIKTIVRVSNAGDGSPTLPAVAIRAIALIANGLSPLQMARNAFRGLRLNALRNGPLDKRGTGSRILDQSAESDPAELDRLDQFASDKVAEDGSVERGLSASEIVRMMDANFERAKGRRRRVDRSLMKGEWPILLRVLGKQAKSGRYLSVAEVRRLSVDRQLPERMIGRLRE